MLVQLGLCLTCSETTLLVFPRGGSNETLTCCSRFCCSILSVVVFLLCLKHQVVLKQRVTTLPYGPTNFRQLKVAAPVAEGLRALFLNHSIISPLCLAWVRAPLWPHVRQAKFCLQVCPVVFLGVLPFSPHLLIGPSHMS